MYINARQIRHELIEFRVAAIAGEFDADHAGLNRHRSWVAQMRVAGWALGAPDVVAQRN